MSDWCNLQLNCCNCNYLANCFGLKLIIYRKLAIVNLSNCLHCVVSEQQIPLPNGNSDALLSTVKSTQGAQALTLSAEYLNKWAHGSSNDHESCRLPRGQSVAFAHSVISPLTIHNMQMWMPLTGKAAIAEGSLHSVIRQLLSVVEIVLSRLMDWLFTRWPLIKID